MRYLYLLLISLLLSADSFSQYYRLNAISHERYSYDSLKFIPENAYLYNYSKGRGGIISYNSFVENEYYGHLSYIDYITWFVPDMKYDSCYWIHTFRANSQIKTINQYFDGNNNIVLRKKNSIPASVTLADSFSYKSNKMVNTFINYIYPINNSPTYYHYNSLGLLDTLNNSSDKYVYTYDVSNRLFQRIHHYTISSTTYQVRSTNYYSGSGFLNSVLYERFDSASVLYRQTARDIYTYTTANDTDMVLHQVWDNPTSSWVNDQKVTYTTDAIHNVLSHVIINWKNSTWDTFRRSSYTYNTSNQLVMNETDFWNNMTHTWEYKFDTFDFGNSQRFTFTYEPYFPTAINTTTANDNSIKLFPVPASGVLNVEVKKEFKNPFKATILDMQGRLYTEWAEEPCAIYNRSIPIDNLPSGLYCLKLMGSEGEIAKQFMVER